MEPKNPEKYYKNRLLELANNSYILLNNTDYEFIVKVLHVCKVDFSAEHKGNMTLIHLLKEYK